MSVVDVSVVEGTGGGPQALVELRLSKAVGSIVTVRAATVADTATAFADFAAVDTSAVFNKRQTTATVAVPIVPDSLDEPDESLRLVLSSPQGATIADGTAVVTILDDDEPAPPPPPPADPADVRLLLTDDELDDQLLVGDLVTYTLAVANLGPADATGVVAVHRIPDYMTFASADPACGLGADGETVTCAHPGDLPAGRHWSPTITVWIDTTDTRISTATVSATTPDPNLANNSDSELTTSLQRDAKVVFHSINPLTGPPMETSGKGLVLDDEREYVMSVIVENEGTTRADGIVVELWNETVDTIAPNGCTTAPTEVPNVTHAAACVVGSLAAGSATSVTFRVTTGSAGSTPAPPYSYSTRALNADVRMRGFGAETVDGQRSYTVSPLGTIHLTPTVQGFTNPFQVRNTTTQIVRGVQVLNQGYWSAHGARLQIEVPTGVTFEGEDGPWSCTPNPFNASVTDCTYAADIAPELRTSSADFRFRVNPLTRGEKEITFWALALGAGDNQHASHDEAIGRVRFNVTF